MGGGPQYAGGPPYGQAPTQPHQQAGYTAPTSQQVSPYTQSTVPDQCCGSGIRCLLDLWIRDG